MKKRIIAVVGSRNFSDYLTLKAILDVMNISKIISGGARGADKLAEKYAKEKEIPFIEHLPDYNKYHGHFAPIIRNKKIVDEADYIMAFWDGKSYGTENVIDYATRIRKPMTILTFVGNEFSEKSKGRDTV